MIQTNRISGLQEPGEGVVHILHDAAPFREAAAAWTSALGYQPVVHQAAFSLTEVNNSPRPACLIMDLASSGGANLDLQAQPQRGIGLPPVVFIGEGVDVRTAVNAMRQGAVALLEQSCDEKEFAQAVGAAIQRDLYRLRQLNRAESLRKMFGNLSERETLVMRLVVEGKLNKAIARELQMTERTVERVRAVLLEKIGAESAVQMACLLTEHRFLEEHLSESPPAHLPTCGCAMAK